MKTKLRILLVEDDVADAELIMHQLEQAGFTFALTRVQTEADFRQELNSELPDVILSDHGLPSFSGFDALEIVRLEFPALPFIFVSGSNDQGMVAQMHDAGATDYVFKRDLEDLKTALLEALGWPLEWLPPQTSTATTMARQDEKRLSPPPPTASAFHTIGQLHFCPQCQQARDEIDRVVKMENYCASRPEVLVMQKICADCAMTPKTSAPSPH